MMDEVEHIQNEEELLRTLTKNYLSDMHSQIVITSQHLESKHVEELILFGHTLKGTGSMFGYEELSAIGARFEEDARNKQWGNLKTLLDEIKTIIDYYLVR